MHFPPLVAASFLLVAAANVLVATPSPAPSPAQVTTDNPIGLIYGVTFSGEVTGGVNATANDDGRGVKYTINVSGFNGKVGPFAWHIHEHKVENGDCKTALAHQNIFHADPEKKCDPNAPETCETGDISGKHGKISSLSYGGFLNYAAQFVDHYTSTKSDNHAFIGNLSVVIHLPDKSRIACANFAPISGGKATKPGNEHSTQGTATSGYPMGTAGQSGTNPASYPTETDSASSNMPPYPTGTGSSHSPSGTDSVIYNTPTSPPVPDDTKTRNKTSTDPYSGAMTIAVPGALTFFGLLAGLYMTI